MEIEFDTDVIQKNEDEVERLKKEIEELKYQIEREKREGDRLKQILAGGSGMLLSPPLSFLLSSSIEKEKLCGWRNMEGVSSSPLLVLF